LFSSGAASIVVALSSILFDASRVSRAGFASRGDLKGKRERASNLDDVSIFLLLRVFRARFSRGSLLYSEIKIHVKEISSTEEEEEGKKRSARREKSSI
jgi:hypothetical protein